MASDTTPSDRPAWQWIKTAALILALALVATRCLTAEYLRDPAEVLPGSISAPRGVGAAMGVLLDLACCLPVILLLLHGALTRTSRRIGIAPGIFFAFAILAAISICWAGDRYAAAVSAAHLLAAAALLWSFAQIIADWQSISAVAAVCLGLLLCLLAQGMYYKCVELPDLRYNWINDVQGTRTKQLAAHNWTDDSFAAKQFALKVLHGDFATFYTSANTFAAMLSLLATVVMGIFLSKPRKNENLILPLLAIPCLWMLWLTQCKAAFVTFALAIAIFVFLRFASSLLIRYRRAAFILVIAGALALIGLTISYGRAHGNLHNDSLNFRWRYWVAAAHMFRQHPLIGVGWESFGEHYLAFRLPSAPEEIKDPHDMLVRACIELGAMGGVCFIAFLLAAWWRMIRPLQPTVSERCIIKAPALMIAVMLAIAINIITSVDFNQISAYVFLETMRRFLFLGLLLIAIIFVLDKDRKRLSPAPLPWLPAAVAVALGLFLLHNLIDFALFDPSPGPMMVFAMLVGCLIGIRSNPPLCARFVWIRFAVVLVVFIAASVFFVIPVQIADADATHADTLFRLNKPDEAILLYAEASRWIAYNAEYDFRLAEALIFNNASPAMVNQAIDKAIAADPWYIDPNLLRARYLQRQSNPDVPTIMSAYQRVLALNPNDVSMHIEFADFLRNYGRIPEAISEYQNALWFNNQFPLEEPKRLPASQVNKIQQMIQQLQHAIASPKGKERIR